MASADSTSGKRDDACNLFDIDRKDGSAVLDGLLRINGKKVFTFYPCFSITAVIIGKQSK